jgi:pSer/pThr/pTyr-binding forkhead associated (FHA) protein
MIRLEVSASGLGGATTARYQYDLDGDEIVIGRSSSCDVALPHEEVSSRHAILRRRGQTWMLADLQSTNGTRFAGERVPLDGRPLADGEEFEVAGFRIRFRAQGGPSATTSEGTLSIARRMVREVLGAVGPGKNPPTLRIVDGPQAGRRFEISPGGRPMTIGRGEGCDIRLEDRDASREHARVERDWAGVVVEDLGAKNPILLGGAPLQAPQRLRHGDLLLVGSTTLRYDDPADQYLRELEGRPDRPSALYRPADSPRPAGGLVAIYVVCALLVVGAALGVWLVLR